jgi:hypothetical protein
MDPSIQGFLAGRRFLEDPDRHSLRQDRSIQYLLYCLEHPGYQAGLVFQLDPMVQADQPIRAFLRLL